MNPQMNQFFSALRVLLIAVGAIMAKEGWEHTTIYSYVMIASGAVMVVGPAIWGVWSAGANWWKAAAIGTQSGINLVLSGKALAADGKTLVSQIGTGTTPAKPVTIETTKEIVQDMAPTKPPAKA